MADERILIVDDEPGVRAALEAILADEGFRVTSAASGEQGLEALAAQAFDAVLLDVWLPGLDGLETLARLRERNVDAEVVMISGHGTIETAVRATKLGAFDFVEKPLSLDRTLLVLRNALRQRRLERSNRRLVEQLARDTEILGHSDSAERLRALVRLAADATDAVLIRGPQGSGRETVARRIHLAGPRPEAPFVSVPCGALDESAAAAALFGGAGQPSRLQLAAGGSLFLEDVERLPPVPQERVAASLPPAGTRLLASIAVDPAPLHPALEARLAGTRIDVPPLNQRREDVPFLAERFMHDLSREYGRPAKRLTPEVLARLARHDWPGNLRELRGLLERVLLVAPGEAVTPEDLPIALGGAAPSDDLYQEFPSLRAGLEAFERYQVGRALSLVGGDLDRAAERLGLSAAALRRRMQELR
ncbi:MAG TPA: sigma-54 dependent transcriptional regulator [Candidatus Polarisedimenticolaceae bacterium]|nr:sigma-54 dependent transcriptional regulator [Candidatus Polarisedimenticolaceae bacterium]